MLRIRRADYFYTTVQDRPGEAFRFLSRLAEEDVDLLAFGATPLGGGRSQLTLFPTSIERMTHLAAEAGLTLDGPHHAILVQGDDRLGALADIHAKLFEVKVNVSASTGVTDGEGQFGYVLYVRPEDIGTAEAALSRLGR